MVEVMFLASTYCRLEAGCTRLPAWPTTPASHPPCSPLMEIPCISGRPLRHDPVSHLSSNSSYQYFLSPASVPGTAFGS
eukprot:1156847-Pelagomonas_calceolata.AAC.5